MTLCFFTGFGQQAKIKVGPNVRVSKARASLTQNEVLLAADPLDPNRLLGSSMVFREEKNAYTTIVYASFEGGKTWELPPELKDFKSSWKPTATM
jgi:hypothetical protein